VPTRDTLCQIVRTYAAFRLLSYTTVTGYTVLFRVVRDQIVTK